MIKQFSIIFLLFLPVASKAQTPLLRHITDEQGLPSMSVYDILQDKKGYIWMATEKGLYRYDGIFFKFYHGKALRGTALSYLQEDKYGRIWGLTFAGQLWHTEGDSLKPFLPFDKDYKSGIPQYYVYDDNILISANNSNLYSYNIIDSKKDSIKYAARWKSRSLLGHNKNNIYTLNADPTAILKIDKNHIISFHASLNKKYNEFKFVNFFSSNEHCFFMTNEKGNPFISIYEILEPRFLIPLNIKLKQVRLNNIFNEKNGDIWLASYNGVLHYDKKGNLLHHFLQGKTVGRVIKDSEDSYWFCTPSDGVYMIPSLKMQLLNTNIQIKKMAHDDENNIYMGATEGRILTYNPTSKKINASFHVDEIDEFQGFNWLKSKYNALFFTNKYYFSWNKEAKITNFDRLLDKKNSGIFGTIKESVLLNEDNYIYSATSFGAIKWHVLNGTYRSFSFKRFLSVKANHQKNEVWYGSAEGFTIANDKDSVREIKTPFSVTDFAITPQGKVWIATDRQGLVLMENDVIVRSWKNGDGLMGNRVQKIIPDINNTFWLTTDGGIQRFDANNYTFRSITRANNLLGTTIYDMTVTDKEVWVATSKGVQYFPKDIPLAPSVKPTLYINEVSINDKIVDLDSVSNTYIFSQNARNIQIKFTGLSYFSGDRFTYRYRIPQLDTNWISTEPLSNYARFQALTNGKYAFEVQLVTEDGRMSEVKTAALNVRPVIWRQWWFYAILTIGAIVSLTLYFRQIIRRIKERNIFERKAATSELEKTKAEEAYRRAQLSALKAQMNPHFLFNALNSIQSYIFSNEKNEANAYLGKFSDLMRITLDMSQNDTIPLDEEIQMLELYLTLESMRLKNALSWSVKTAENIDHFHTLIPPLLIQPYVENGIKHGLSPKKSDRQISIYFYQNEDNYLICEVTDNGIGRKKALEFKNLRHKQYASFSTSATEQRLQLLNMGKANKIMVEYQDLILADGTAGGTKAIISIQAG
jgi:ligand-binding sensor domain-containing protein